MKRIKKINYSVLLSFSLLYSVISYSQIRFEKGYFTDNTGNKIECLIRNVGWPYNPSFFEYKIDDNAPVSRKEVNEVKEFGIGQTIKYLSAKVSIDRSSDLLDDNAISASFAPEWREDQVFLKVLEEGDATLLSYEEQDFIRFFYQVKSLPAEQLIYKRYKQPGELSFAYNQNYLNQLFIHVNCRNVPISKLENISYTANSLLKWFQKHNECMNPDNPAVKTAKKKKWFSPKILAGINYLSYQSGSSSNAAVANIKYDTKIGLTFGVELEFLLPFNNNKWSVIAESSTLSYTASGVNASGDKATVKYNTINVLLGIRYYSFLNDKVKVLFDAGFVKDIKQSKITPSVGMGISYSRFMTEFRYFFQKGLYHHYFDLTTGERFSNMFLAVKYRLF